MALSDTAIADVLFTLVLIMVAHPKDMHRKHTLAFKALRSPIHVMLLVFLVSG